MKNIYLYNYSVKGIKSLNETAILSFYKKCINKDMEDTRKYNIKGIYGMNGSGKSGIIASVNILKNLIINPEYLNNPIVQKNLDEMINKKLGELYIEADYIIKHKYGIMLFNYMVTLSKNDVGKYVISHERLAQKNKDSKHEISKIIFEVSDGELVKEYKNKFYETIHKKTLNLLSNASMSALTLEKYIIPLKDKINSEEGLVGNMLFIGILMLINFGDNIHVYLDQEDEHRKYLVLNMIDDTDDSDIELFAEKLSEIEKPSIKSISSGRTIVGKEMYSKFESTVAQLYEFIKIFKSDLKNIEIDKKEDGDFWVCNLVMVYDDYRIDSEFESTGIKKLIKLFAYLKEMVNGSIVFIDEFDSNLHDVYLCALLEYLMEYGEGQLCFTTHNVGPMDILKQNKMSIDFLSEDHKIYPWTTNGNYSPSKLYRNGMIEGSPFNVDSIDFIGAFGSGKED